MSEENSAPIPLLHTSAEAAAETPETVPAAMSEPAASDAAFADEPPVPPVEAPLNVGDRLRSAREAKGLTLAEVAQSLKLSVRQIEALEAGDWSRLPGATFVRGFLRNYARLLQIDATPLIAALDAERPAPPPQPLALPQRAGGTLPQGGRAERRDLLAVFAGLALVVLALAAYFLVPENFWGARQGDVPAAEAPADAPAPPAEPGAGTAAPVSEAASAPSASAADKSSSASALISPAASPAAAAKSATPPPLVKESLPASAAPPAKPAPTAAAPVAAAAPAAAAAGESALTFSFAQPAWVEVRDRSGQLVFSQLSPAGAERRIDGRPPFTLVVGNATNVSLRYKGKPVEFTQRSKDDVARLTLE